jgi:hypothetical protein
VVFVNSKILVDIDYKYEDRERMVKMVSDFVFKMYFVTDVLGVRFTGIKVYETNKGIHIYLDAESERPLTPLEIIVIQLCLGSDYKRELYNLRRARAWLDGEELENNWNTLFKYKYKNGKLVSKETVTEFSKFFEDYVMRRYNSLLRGESE